MSANAANKKANAQYKSGLQQEADSWKQNIATNEAIGEANLQNTIRTGYKVGILNVQKAQAKRELISRGINVRKQVMQAAAAATANQAASGTVGSSADAVLADLQREGGEAIADIDYQDTQNEYNFVNMLTDLVTQGQDALQSGQANAVSKTEKPALIGMGEVAVGAALSTASMWGSAKLDLGLGNKKL